MNILSLKNIINKIIDTNIFYSIYEYSIENKDETVNLNNLNVLNISKEVIFIILLKIMIPRNFKKLNYININIHNEQEELKYSLIDSDSLFNIYLYENLEDNFFIFDNKKIYNGHCVLSKHEVIKMKLLSNVKFKIINKRYYSININDDDYINLIDKILNLLENKFDFIIYELDKIINNFNKTIKIECRKFVVDLILRDYYNLLKEEINKLEGNGHIIHKVKDTNISYI